MKHRVFGRKLSRTKNERRRLLQGLARDMLKHGQVKTTLAKAKAVQPLVEKLITHAKAASGANLMQIRKVLADKQSVQTLLVDAQTRFSSRTSGYTRILKLDARRSDAAQMALLSFVDVSVVTETIAPLKDEKKMLAPKNVKAKVAKEKPKARKSKKAKV